MTGPHRWDAFLSGVLLGLLCGTAAVLLGVWLAEHPPPPVRPPTDPVDALKWEVWAAAERILREPGPADATG